MDDLLFAEEWDLIQLSDDLDFLSIELDNGKGVTATIKFDEHLSYRCRDESDAGKTLALIREPGSPGKTLYEVADSDFVKWFTDERGFEFDGAKHFCVSTLNWVIDIIALKPPDVMRTP